MSEPIYRRVQAEWSLWRAFVDPPPRGEIDATAKTRIKRLLDIDRNDAPASTTRQAGRWAFSAQPTSGSGTEAAFRAFDVFCLGLGLELLDMGFKQGEIVFLIRHIRPVLQPAFRRIIDHYPPLSFQRHGAKDYPSLPRTRDGREPDDAVFLLIRKVEVDEFIRLPTRRRTQEIFAPAFCFGETDLIATISTSAVYRRKAIIVELARLARQVQRLLQDAPVRRRGPKP